MKKFQKKINEIGKTISVESKVNIVGSASVQRSIYYSDYDLFEEVNDKTTSQLYSHFKSLYHIFKSTDNTVVSDFKLGGMHWTENDVMNREKNGVSFDDALKKKGIIKIDIITLLNGRFIEITEVYKICFDKKCNMDYEKDEVLKEITDEYKQEVSDGNFMKSLKKMYSIMKLKNSNDPKLNILIEYFNSPIGYLYRCKSDLETLIIAMRFQKFKVEDVNSSLELLKELISAFPVENHLEEIINMKTKEKKLKPLEKQVTLLRNYINKETKKFLVKSRL